MAGLDVRAMDAYRPPEPDEGEHDPNDEDESCQGMPEIDYKSACHPLEDCHDVLFEHYYGMALFRDRVGLGHGHSPTGHRALASYRDG